MFARLATLALATALLSSQAIASGEFEYTMSEPTTTVTTYGTATYGTTVAPAYQPSEQGTMDVYQTQTAPATQVQGGFGELVYDSGPYLPNGNTGVTTGTTQTYTTQPVTDVVTYDQYGQPILAQETDASWK